MQKADKQKYVIKGFLKGIDSGTVKLVMYNEDDHTTETIDSGIVINRGLQLKGRIDGARMMKVAIPRGTGVFSFFVEDTTVTVMADTADSVYYDYTSYGDIKGALMKNVSETGSANCDDWMRYQNDPGQQQYNSAYELLDPQLGATMGNVNAVNKVRNKMESVQKALQAWQLKWIGGYMSAPPDAVAGAYMFSQLT
jgi:hypothetical protein